MCDFSGGQSARVASTLSRAARGGQPEEGGGASWEEAICSVGCLNRWLAPAGVRADDAATQPAASSQRPRRSVQRRLHVVLVSFTQRQPACQPAAATTTTAPCSRPHRPCAHSMPHIP